ncbi:MAG: aminopeptidase [Deltaproteobacteria bacterium]|nr:aminopeptidase [Deltaproteobacteria bacterium]
MMDPRVTRLAEVLVDYSCGVKKGETVGIVGIGTDTLPLVKELHRLCLLRGAVHVNYQIRDMEIEKDFYNLAGPEQIAHFPKDEMQFMKSCDCWIAVRAAENSMVLANANQKNFAARAKALRKIFDERVNNTRWVVTIFPTHGAAQEAKMSKEEFEDFFFDATIFDYAGLQKKQRKLAALMKKTDQVRIKASDTDLTLSIKGIPIISCFGDRNIPDGEVFTAPVRDSVNGYIKYNTPSIYQGKEFDGVYFEVKNGKIVKAECGEMTKELNAVMDSDAGARYFGEFAIGTNPKIRRPMRNILFDEKIFGSVHLTPGRAYNEADNGNRSSVHWDLVKILVGDGDLYFDGRLIQHNGYFVEKSLLDLNPPKERKLAEKFLARQGSKKK